MSRYHLELCELDDFISLKVDPVVEIPTPEDVVVGQESSALKILQVNNPRLTSHYSHY